MLLSALRTVFLHQTLYFAFENIPCFFSSCTNKEREILIRNTLCWGFAIHFSLLGLRGNAPENLRNHFLGYVGSDSLVMFRKQQFNTWENWIHHGVSCILLCYTAFDPTRDNELFQIAGVGEISTIFLCFADTFRQIPRFQDRFPLWNQCFRIGFTLSFLAIRVVWWTHVILVQAQPFHTILGSLTSYISYSLLGLQYYWGGLLLRHVKKIIK